MDAIVKPAGAKHRVPKPGNALHAIFDAAYYLRQNPDVAEAGADPLAHFLAVGWAEGRNPCALFDTEFYLERNPDVAQAGLNPLVHYIASGAAEGRQTSLLFDAAWYRAKNPDIAEAAAANPLLHYLTQGAAEGREANPLFDQAWYLRRYPDALNEASCALAHYAERGAKEPLSPHPLFDGAFYLERNPDVAQTGVNPLAHFLLRGHEEIRQPHPLFDADWYLKTYPDVAATRTNPLLHYLWEGAREGRNPNLLFDQAWYLKRYPDALNHASCALTHYVEHGVRDRLSPHPLFDGAYYLDKNPDVRASGMNPLTHFLLRGREENRRTHVLVDVDWYRRVYPDVAVSRIHPLLHYLQRGAQEGRQPHALFDTEWYLTEYADIRLAGVNPLAHFLSHGAAEGRHPHALARSSIYTTLHPEAAKELHPMLHYARTGRSDIYEAYPQETVRHAGTKPVVIYDSHNLKLQGAPICLVELARGIQARGAYHCIMTSNVAGPLADLCGSGGVDHFIHGVPQTELTDPAKRAAAISKLAARYKQQNPALIHVNTLQNFHCILAAKEAGIPAIWHVHESEDPDTYYDYLPADLRALAYSCVDKAACMVFVAEATRRLWTHRLGNVKNVVIHNGLELDAMTERVAGADRAALRAGLGVGPEDVLVLSVGSVTPRKGQEDLVDAWPLLSPEVRAKTVLCMVGLNSSDYALGLMRKVEALRREGARIITVPESRDDAARGNVAELFLCADIFALTSRIESFPRVIQEAMAFRLAIVATPCFGVNEQIESGVSGLFYKAGDGAELARQLTVLCSDARARLRYGEAAHKRLWQLNSYEQMLEAYERLYREIVRGDEHSETGAGGSLSILVVSRTADNVTRLLRAIAQESLDGVEVLCSWNGSVEDAEKIKPPAGLDFRLVEQRPYNFARNNNGLARLARGAFVLFINDDVVPDRGALRAALHAIRQPHVGMVGINLRYPDGLIQHAGVEFRPDGTPYHRMKHKLPADHDLFATDRFVPAVTGAFIMMRAAEFRQLGFDEAFKVCGEDIALNISYREKFDREILFLAGATAVHVENATRKETGETVTPPEDMARILSYTKRVKAGAPLSHPTPLRIRIVTEEPGWIMHRKAEEIQKYLGKAQVRINEDWDEADIHYYINFHYFRERPHRGLVVANFTHHDPASGSNKFARAGHEVDHCVAVSKSTAQDLRNAGVPDSKISTILVGADLNFKPRLTVGVVGRVYEGGRKGEDIVKALLADPAVTSKVRIVASKEGWDAPVWSFEDPADFYRAIDYLLVPSRIEGGPVPVMEALACGTMSIAPEIGVIPQFPHVSYPTGDIEALKKVLIDVANKHIQQRAPLTAKMRGLNWTGWAVEHEKVFRELLWRQKHGASPTNEAPTRAGGDKDVAKIAFITTNDHSYSGGSEVWWRETAMRLRSQGHDISVLIRKWDPRPAFLTAFENAGIRVLYKENDGFQTLMDMKPDLVTISVGDQDDGIEYYPKLVAGGLPYVIVNRLTKEEKYWPIRHFKQGAVKAGYLAAEKIFFASGNNHGVMERRLGVALPRWGRIFSPCHADRTAALPFPSMEQGPRLAFPANILFLHKGHDILAEALKAPAWAERRLTVNVYGEGPDEEPLKALLAAAGLSAFAFHGPIVKIGQEQEIAAIWRDNHAVVAPSRMEGFPNMVLNAMLSGRVPIVTDIGGHTEIITDDVNGFVAAEPEAECFRDALERAYQRRADWPAMGEAARRAALDYLPPDPVADAAEKLLTIAFSKRTAQRPG